ncbi:hypothetical protein GL263_22250 [Streptomyces durbertensis]|uniref:Uncharacterized protein n=1 Tax=Streptomyces durbertensis TaxID=2448886 RepID=A0ABR6EMY2_9ACTN|nr:hypothetical protein [Streptomyces durbertensis]MBB1246255.1 hypothetical protein [Streptomyces durbertensis]
MRRKSLVVLSALVAATLAPGGTALAGGGPGGDKLPPELQEVRDATARFHSVWEAQAEGYELASPCVEGMGFHFAKSIAADQSELKPTEPNVLVYAPTPNGGLKLVAVEYASQTAATLFGQDFDPPNGLPFYTLHAWIWKKNPKGVFNATNPKVSCDVNPYKQSGRK